MRKYILLFIGLTLFVSCTEAVIEDLPPDPIPTQIKYNDDVKAIIDANCVSCHGAISPNAGLSLTTYQQVRDATENGNLINRINNVSAPMPPSNLMPSTNRAIIDQWVLDGYIEN